MQSFLIISQDKQKRELYAQKKCDEHAINLFDRTIITPEKSIGIEEVRVMQKKAFFKPFKGELKAVILYDTQTITIEAQSALLKILEEPPLNTFLLLTAESIQTFLPTILSRCTLLLLDNTTPQLPTERSTIIQSDFHTLKTAGVGLKLKKAQDIAKDKERAILWLRDMLFVVRLEMLTSLDQVNDKTAYITTLRLLQHAYQTTKKTNINLRFLLEDTFLHIEF